MSLITAPGIYADLTPLQYFAEPCPAPACTNSTIKVLLDETPQDAAYQHGALTPDRDTIKASAEMMMGDVVHQLALGKGRGYKVLPFDAFRSKEAKEARDEALDAGLTPLTEEKFLEAEAMASVVRGRIEQTLAHIARKRGAPEPTTYATEVVFAWVEETRHGPVWCRGMADVWCEELGFIGDPKVTGALTNSRIAGHTQKQGWPRQAAWYLRGFGAILPAMAGRLTFANILVKPKPPYTVRCTAPMEAWRTVAERECEHGLDLFARCLRAGQWPGYADGIEMLEAPGWVLREIEDDEDD
jgi:hypothetical protein